jgi:tRNA (guanine-N7-)-methyltransferase
VVDSQAVRLKTCPLNMRGRAKLQTHEAAVEYLPKSLTSALEIETIFSRFAPVEIDLGCGDGTFLTAMARENPAHNFLGIERLLGRMRTVCRKVARLDLKNARVLRMESSYAVTHLLPTGSVTAFHLLFSDPWPKRRHHRRRAFTHEFLFSIHRALIAGGLFHVATDHTDYFRQIEKVIAETDIFAISREQNNFPPTSFEQKFIARGLPVFRLLLRKVRRLSNSALSILHHQTESRLRRSGPGEKV